MNKLKVLIVDDNPDICFKSYDLKYLEKALSSKLKS